MRLNVPFENRPSFQIEKINDAADAIKDTRKAKKRLRKGLRKSKYVQVSSIEDKIAQ